MDRSLLGLALAAPALVAQPAPFPAGEWTGTIQVPGPGLGISVTLAGRGSAWTGRISIPAQGVKDQPLDEVQVTADTVSFAMNGIPGIPRFAGRQVREGVIEGRFTQGGHTFPFSLTRGAAAPRPVPQDPRDRDLAFPGFNAFPLKGSVRKGGAHPYFAVMVAGSGPTDRDWSNPLIPAPSHGGRDFAAWLEAQGIGSLRFDKRFIGSKDPKLDISLDAQVGDIRAAMKAARALPEAKGKKLLLVGHSEGALLALLAAGDADAALLLAMPGMSYAKTILAQVKGQLDAAGAPGDAAAQNLAYLESVLEAIRKGQDLPPAAAGVAPGVVALGKGLTRPESRGFVRDLLDLDPWGAAQRLPIPCAVAWGERDVQTWKPEVLPPDFKGTVIQIPEANHLFKRETRERAALSGREAMTAYGDGTPLADLTPLAAWLKALR
jgi:pimeloyl-ACP methyl ester carboxylesterase